MAYRCTTVENVNENGDPNGNGEANNVEKQQYTDLPCDPKGEVVYSNHPGTTKGGRYRWQHKACIDINKETWPNGGVSFITTFHIFHSFYFHRLSLLHDPAITILEDLMLVVKHATIPELIMGLLVAVVLWAIFLAVDKTGRHKLALGLSVLFFFGYLFYVSVVAWLTLLGSVGMA